MPQMDNRADVTPPNNTNSPTTNSTSGMSRRQKNIAILSGLGVVLFFASLVIGSAYYLLSPTTDTAKWRDYFIIILTVEAFMLGCSTFILVIQVARLINLVQNEVQPVLEAANETINTLRGTAVFLSDNLVKPVVKVNGYIAAVRRMLGFINTGK